MSRTAVASKFLTRVKEPLPATLQLAALFTKRLVFTEGSIPSRFILF